MRVLLRTVLCCLLILPLLVAGQPMPLKFKHLTINEGLSQNTVFATLQDAQGFVWIATEDGLNRYNGYNFNIYKHDTTLTSLSGNQINTLFESRDQTLWIGTSDGLNIYNRRKDNFRRLYTFPKKSLEINDVITNILQDKNGNIWVATFNGLKLYQAKTDKFIPFLLPNPTNNKLTNKIQTLALAGDNLLFVGTGNDLKEFNTLTRQFVPLPALLAQNEVLKRGGIRCIKPDTKGTYWIGTENAGLFNYEPAKNTCINYREQPGNPTTLPSNMVRDILIPGNGQVWVGTREGLGIFQDGKFKTYTYDKYGTDGLTFNSVRHLMKDRAGNIWVGTYAGGVNIFYAESRNFTNISEQVGRRPGLSERMVSAIIRNNDGSFWLGTEGGGLNFADVTKGVYKYYGLNDPQTIPGSNTVKSLSKDAKGNLWVGAYNGLYYFNTAKRQFTNFKIINRDTTSAGKQIYAVEASGSSVVLGTNGAGVQILEPNGQLTTYRDDPRKPHSLSCNNVTSLLYDHGNYWVGTQRGLNYFDSGAKSFTQFKFNEKQHYSISNNAILSLFRDSKGRFWIGTEGGGLNYYDSQTGRFYAINERLGLANSVVHAINEDKKGQLWVSTNKGLARINLGVFKTPFVAANIMVTNYSIADGLATNQFSTGATNVSRDGDIVFGSISGITLFDPASIITNDYKPPIVLTDLLIRNRPALADAAESPLSSQINEASEVTLTHDQGFISFKFAALNFINPDNNQYAYKLEGFKGDNDWHYVGNQRMVSYTNLDAGTYIFKVKGANNDGVWTDHIKSIKLIVLPPWWKTWWAYIIYLAIIGLMLYLFNSYSVKNERLTNELKYEHLNHQKDQELAQRKLSFFTNISHEIKTPLTLILTPLEKLIRQNDGNNKVQNQLMLMQRNGERLIRLINQLLDFRKFEAGNMTLKAAEGNVVRFINEIVISFDGYAQSKQIALSFKAGSPEIKVYYDQDKLEKILYNLLSNALKFTAKGGKVAVNVRTEAEQLLIEVEDNGVGVPPENLTKIFDCFNHFSDSKQNKEGTGIGLSFSKGMAELHHGSIEVVSRVSNATGRGATCFTVRLPLGCAHLEAVELNNDYPDSENIVQYDSLTREFNSRATDLPALITEDADKPMMLVVEDNPEVLNFIAANFITAYQVHTAEDGLEGLRLATELIPDIIISDVMMPNMNGIALCTTLKTDARTSHIPVILLTARTPLIFKLEGLETGADDYITKPFSLDILEARVYNLIDSRKRLRDRYSKEISLQPHNIAITSADEKFLTKLMAYIEINIANSNLSVDDLGKAVGMSRATLYRKVKGLTNQTALEFIRDLRIKRAAQLLEQNKFNVSEVAYLVGFIDVDYFRKCFKEKYGFTPKEYVLTEHGKSSV
jgi:ligand-binding sensor domain-containing protein/signal transduction histidine kinase/DNA-binding response OmpR family regulator